MKRSRRIASTTPGSGKYIEQEIQAGIIMAAKKRLQAELSMLLIAAIWGSTFAIVKNALSEIGPFLFVGLRFLLAFSLLLILSFPCVKKTNRSTLLAGGILGLLLFIGYIFQTIGLKYTSSTNAGFITGISVVLVPIIYSLLYRKRPAVSTAITVILAAIGLFFLSFPSNTLSLAYGDFLLLICAFGFALHIIFVDRYSHQHNAIAITAVQILFVGIASLLIGLISEPWPSHFSANLLIALFITAVFATSLAFLLQNALQKYSTPTRFAVILTTEPVFAALTGYLWAQEVLSRRAMFGAGLILLSMLISVLIRKGKNPVEAKI